MSQPKIVVNKHTPSVVEAFSRLGEVVALETLAVTKERGNFNALLSARNKEAASWLETG